MATIVHEPDAELTPLDGATVAVVGYGNQGRSWALNLRDSGNRRDGVRARRRDTRTGRAPTGSRPPTSTPHRPPTSICILVPDDVIPSLPLAPRDDALVVVASGYTLAFGRLDPGCDVGLVAPADAGARGAPLLRGGRRVHHRVRRAPRRDRHARDRVLAVAKAIGGLRQGAIELTPHQEAVLDLAVEQALSPALRRVSQSFVQVMLEHGIPLEAIVTELVLSGEVERTYRLLRIEGYAAQMEHHSPTSQYGQLSRAEEFDHLDVPTKMREIVEGISSGRFADEWDGERDAGYPNYTRLKDAAVGVGVAEFDRELRAQLGEGAIR